MKQQNLNRYILTCIVSLQEDLHQQGLNGVNMPEAKETLYSSSLEFIRLIEILSFGHKLSLALCRAFIIVQKQMISKASFFGLPIQIALFQKVGHLCQSIWIDPLQQIPLTGQVHPQGCDFQP